MDLSSAQNAWNNLRTAARKDPKKAGVLAFLVLVMAGMWVKVLSRSEPARAAGATPPARAGANRGGPAAAGGATVSDNARVGGGGGGMRTAAWSSGRLEPVTRNLFLIQYDRYPQAGQSTAAPGNPVQQSAPAAAEVAKSGPSPADLRKERQILIANLQQQASQLKLQTTVMGATPKALVNGSLVGEGDVVASFRIVRITNRGMVIEREGIRLDVQMK